MILPVSDSDHDRPWATYLLIALCVLVFVPVHFSSKNKIREGLRLLEEATEYYAAHPYLELDPRLEEILWRGAGADAKQAAAGWKDQLRKKSRQGSDFGALEQAELDGLTHAGFDILEQLPHWSLSVVPRDLSKLSLVSHLFVHAAWLPLLGNLVFLYLIGSYLEARWRAPLLLACFLLSGVVAAGVFILKYPEFPVPLSGASGAVAGLVGAYAMTYGAGRVSFRYWLGPTSSGELAVPALLLVALWGVREGLTLVSQEALLPDTGAAGAAYWDHLGGLGCGLLLGAVIRFGKLERRLGGAPVRPTKPTIDAGARAVERARTAWREGRGGEAWQTLRSEARRDPGNRQAVVLLWELSAEEGRQAEAAPEMIRLVYHLSRTGAVEEAFSRWEELRKIVPDGPVPAATEVRLGHGLLSKNMDAEAQKVLATAAARVGPRELPMTLVTLAKALQQGPEQARIAQLALDHPDLPPGERVALESLLPASPAETAPGEQSIPPDNSPIPLATAETPARSVPLKVVEAIPLGVQKNRLGIELTGGGRRVLPLAQIKGIAAAEVYDGGVEPDYVIDLVLSFPAEKSATASVVRFHSDRFDPRRLVPTEPEVGDALLSLAGQLLTGSNGMWLLGVQPTELRSYDSPAEYQRELLTVLRLHAGSS